MPNQTETHVVVNRMMRACYAFLTAAVSPAAESTKVNLDKKCYETNAVKDPRYN